MGLNELSTSYVFFAYLDPGTGSYLLQMGLASLLGASYALKLYWSRIKRFLARSSSRADDTRS